MSLIKRQRSSSPTSDTSPNKKVKTESSSKANGASTATQIYELPGKIATFDAAAAVDANPPLQVIQKAMSDVRDVEPGQAVCYWMRMEDLRLEDNRGLAFASAHAQQHSIPLLVLFVLSPGDYKSHDRSPRRIDFALRNLEVLQTTLKALHIPLHVISHPNRTTIPNKVISLLKTWKATRLFANIEYEVDELRRDIKTLALGRETDIECSFIADKLIVEPGKLSTKQGKQYAVYSPWFKSWIAEINAHPNVLKESESPSPNDKFIHTSELYSALFDTEVPKSITGFECADRDAMTKQWPAGANAAKEIFNQFLHTKARQAPLNRLSPIEVGASETADEPKVLLYKSNRDRCDIDGTSRMSPYLASGVISCRTLIRLTMAATSMTTFSPDRNLGPGSFLSELAWRDFYTHVLAAFPRTSMGRPFQEKYAVVKWERDEEKLTAWKEGRTGVPIVDAAMRQGNSQGWMHNRARMIAAMYLTKDLLVDWRLGERHFMENFIDGDLASNNGGWQWSASTGTDPQPYFRIFNPYTQSEKADPSGDYIRQFVPELKHLKGKALYDPFHNLDRSAFKRLGYPEPIVDHAKARERALRRYKNPGEE